MKFLRLLPFFLLAAVLQAATPLTDVQLSGTANQVKSGGNLTVTSGGRLIVASSGNLTASSGSTLTVSGNLTGTPTGGTLDLGNLTLTLPTAISDLYPTKANNLSDLGNLTTARTNLGVAIGTDVQAYSDNLTTFAGIAPSSDVQTLLGAADYAAVKTALSLTPGTDVQAYSGTLDTLATGSAFVAFTGPSSSAKTFTLPNASANILTDYSLVTVAQGGTGLASFTKGDLLVALNSTTLGKLGVGADGYVLTADSAQTSGVDWKVTAGLGAPGTTTDNALATWNGTAGAALRNTAVTLSGNTFATSSGDILLTPNSGIADVTGYVKAHSASGNVLIARGFPDTGHDNANVVIDLYDHTSLSNSAVGIFGLTNGDAWASPVSSFAFVSTKNGSGTTKAIAFWSADSPSSSNLALYIPANTARAVVGGSTTDDGTHTLQVAGSGGISTNTIGGTLAVKSGTNAKAGTFTLSSGAATVSNTSVTANSVIVVTVATVSGTRTGNPDIVPTASTGFTATGGASDNSTYNYVILEVN